MDNFCRGERATLKVFKRPSLIRRNSNLFSIYCEWRTENVIIVAHGILRQLLGGYFNRATRKFGIFKKRFRETAIVSVRKTALLLLIYPLRGYDPLRDCNESPRGDRCRRVRHDLNVIELARSHFADAEIETILAVPRRSRCFLFRCWTKRAFIKARGEGLSFPWISFAVTLDMSPKLSWVHEDPTPLFAGACSI